MKNKHPVNLSSGNIFSLIYHNLFEYPLTALELIKWQPGRKVKVFNIPKINYGNISGYYYLTNKKGLVFLRILRKKISQKKIVIAKSSLSVLKKIPFIKMVAITGSLSMLNAKDNADIDLMIITQKGRLWTSRLATLFLLKILGYKVRRYKDIKEKNKICINIWIDETNLTWPKKDRNFYTAHEIAQIVPIFDRGKTYQMFLNKNIWIKNYWPNAVKIQKTKRSKFQSSNLIAKTIENICYLLQKFYMRKKITREVVNRKKAIFHPIDRSTFINVKLKNFINNTYSNNKI